MFLNIIKNFLLKNKVSKLLLNLPNNHTKALIKSVGVIFDGGTTLEIENLVYELFKHGIEEDKIKVLIFKDKINKKEVHKFDVVSYQDINWSGDIVNPKAELFLNSQFDLLINYHDFESPPLVYLSYLSNANFKVGFNSRDKKINQFMINTNPNNYQLFLDELFKYLKILNKL
jgi:hypothetical protein